MGKRSTLIVCISLLAMTPVRALAAETTKAVEDETSDKPRLEKEIIVTASRTEQSVSRVPVSTFVLSGEDLEQSPGSKPDEILRNVPGINVTLSDARVHYPPSSSRLTSRGVPGLGMLVLLDGVPIHDPYRGFVEWEKVSLDSIARLEVVRGASASLYGNYSIGGTINLITRPITDRRVRIEASYGSRETSEFSLALEHQATRRSAFALGYEKADTDGYIRAIPEVRGEIDFPNWAEYENIQLRGEFRPSDFSQIRIRAGFFDDSRAQGTPRSGNSRDVADYSLSGLRAIGSDASLSYALSYRDGTFNNTNVRLNSARDRETLSNSTAEKATSWFGSAQWSRSPSPSIPLIVFGIDSQIVDGESSRFNYSDSSVVVNGGARTLAAGFGQISWQRSDRLDFTFGARVDYWENRTGFQSDSDGLVEWPAKTTTQLDPKFSARYAVNDRTVLRGSIFRAFRAPEIRDLYRNSGARGRTTLGNPNLGPEIFEGIDFGVVTSSETFRMETNLFWSLLTDSINDLVITEQPLVLMPENIGQAESYGIELIGTWTPSSRVTVTGGYVYTNSTITDNPSDRSLEGNRVEKNPEHQVRATLRYRMQSTGLSAVLSGRYEDETFNDTTNLEVLDAHTVFDVSVNYPVNDRLEIFAKGENIFDRKYVAEITVDPRLGQPFTLQGGVRLRFDY